MPGFFTKNRGFSKFRLADKLGGNKVIFTANEQGWKFELWKMGIKTELRPDRKVRQKHFGFCFAHGCEDGSAFCLGKGGMESILAEDLDGFTYQRLTQFFNSPSGISNWSPQLMVIAR
jgi:hypothetical protein